MSNKMPGIANKQTETTNKQTNTSNQPTQPASQSSKRLDTERKQHNEITHSFYLLYFDSL